MSKYFLIASAVLLLATVGLNVMTKGKLSAKADELKAANDKATMAQTDLTKANKAKKDAEDKAKEAAAKAAELEGQMSATVAARDEAMKKAASVDEEIKKRDDKIAELQKFDQYRNLPKTDATAANPQIEQQLAEVTAQRDELKTVKDGLDNKVKNLEGQVAQFEQERQRRIAGTLKPGLRGQILAVDRNWNFVVLSLGDRNGVNPRATMVVTRGGSMVGKVRITSVEPSQSIADIVPNSVPPGVSVQAGDTVIYQ